MAHLSATCRQRQQDFEADINYYILELQTELEQRKLVGNEAVGQQCMLSKGNQFSRKYTVTEGRAGSDAHRARQVGERIRQLRTTKLRLDQISLAQKLGVSHGAISYWERGGNAKPSHLRRFCQLAGVSLEWLLNGSDDVEAFHPRWKTIEQRMMHVHDDDIGEMFQFIEFMLDQRDRRIEAEQKRAREAEKKAAKKT